MSAAAIVLLALFPAALAQSCPAKVPTACGPSQTCCPTFESLTGWGCCNMPGAVCCPAGPQNQNCCPAGYTCVSQGYGATCVPPAGSASANTSGTHICTPGAALPPSAAGALPTAITIGDSVSEGYQPPLSANLSAVALVQHSPHSQGGGADDVFNGLACEENFLRTAMYAPANWTLVSAAMEGRQCAWQGALLPPSRFSTALFSPPRFLTAPLATLRFPTALFFCPLTFSPRLSRPLAR